MNESILQRAEILNQQSRHQEAISLIESHLEKNPDDIIAKYYYLSSLIQSGDKEKSRPVLNSLLMEEPDSSIVLALAVQFYIAEENYTSAETFAGQLIQAEPYEAESHILMARVKSGQRNYDKALEYTNRALSLDPENIQALNLKTFIAGFIRDKSVNATLQESLRLDPDNPFTIANQGLQLLREGKRKEALERFKYALSLNPANELARYGMQEAMKSKFFLYRWFFTYKEWTSRLTATQLWIFLLGTYFGFRFVRNLAEENAELAVILFPIVYICMGLFILTWIVNPLMNLILLANPYGRLLLDEEDKKMALYSGITFTAALIAFGLYFTMGSENLLFTALLFILFMIPLGTFLNVETPKNRRTLTIMTVGIIISGALGAFLDISQLKALAYIGIFIYQFVYNGMMIHRNARVR